MPRNDNATHPTGHTYTGKAATRVFRTLRDMADSMTIDFDELEFVEVLGGAPQTALT